MHDNTRSRAAILEFSRVPLEEKIKVKVDIVQYYSDFVWMNNREITINTV